MEASCCFFSFSFGVLGHPSHLSLTWEGHLFHPPLACVSLWPLRRMFIGDRCELIIFRKEYCVVSKQHMLLTNLKIEEMGRLQSCRCERPPRVRTSQTRHSSSSSKGCSNLFPSRLSKHMYMFSKSIERNIKDQCYIRAHCS